MGKLNDRTCKQEVRTNADKAFCKVFLMIQDIVVTSYDLTDSYKQRAVDNFKYLWTMKDSCTDLEQERLEALNN